MNRRSSIKPKAEATTAPLAVIGIDIGKDVFHLVGFGVDGKIAFRRRIRRLDLKEVFEKLPPCIVGMLSASRSSRYWKTGRTRFRREPPS
jgi:hypothetical protein